MTTQTVESYLKHPTYNLVLKLFQAGEWDASINAVDTLMQHFPLERDLTILKKDIVLRAKLDKDEETDEANYRRSRIMMFFVRVTGILMLLALVFITVRTFSGTLEQQLQIARQAIEQEILLIDQSAKYRDAESLLQSGRPDEALVLLKEIVDGGGDFPALQDTLLEAQTSSGLKAKYDEARRLVETQDWIGARLLLEEISESALNYRDVSLLLVNLETFAYMSEIYSQSMLHFEAEEWVAAVDGYESLRVLDPSFESIEVEERLFTSYVNAARQVLVDQEDSLEALGIAEAYFRKALALRPQNPEIKSERELARYYIDAQSAFLEGQWTEVIAALEVVHAKDPRYATGSALQTLYEAYAARGDIRMSAGEYEAALSDFQRAVILAEQDSKAVLRLYEAQLKTADAQGAQNNYEAAVLLYRSAVEISRLRTLAQEEDLNQLALLDEAEYYATQGNFSVAYERYRSALGITPGNFCMSFDPYQDALHFNSARQSMQRHIVGEGEYLTLIANRYQSTVCAIVLANEISDPNTIYQGQELLIPVLQ